MYILQYIILNFQKLFWEVSILHAVFWPYALVNFRSPNQYTISIDLLSIRISIRIISIRISNQSKHRDTANTEIEGIRIKLYQKLCLVLYHRKQVNYISIVVYVTQVK